MVSWINMYADASGYQGTVAAYGRIVTNDPNLPRRALFITGAGGILASPGSVDSNLPTRFQYKAHEAFLPLFRANAAFRYTADDVTAYPGKTFTATAFLALASAFGAGVTPTPDQIRLAAVEVARGGSTRTTAGDLNNISMFRDLAGDINNITPYPPNVKYWLAVFPTAVTAGSAPSIANDVPMYGTTHGRALSLWTNRTPLAPTITEPVGQSVVFSGQTLRLRFAPQDPDRIVSFPGDSGIADFEDMAGVQIQYRSRPTVAVPNPAWADLPIANLAGTAFGGGWYMDRLPVTVANEGARAVWASRELPILCGDNVGMAPAAVTLPSGDWELRVRTFDYGHGWSDADYLTVSPPGTPGLPPLDDQTLSYTPDNYPAVNTSPWSASVEIFIIPQVPAPIPVSPVGSAAMVEGAPVTLTWRYRNTYSPPYPQEKRTIQIREVGETTWTTLVNEQVSASSSYTVTGYPLVSGNQYEWRVQVTDSSPKTSEFSNSAFFWVVPAPGAGEVIAEPTETIEGATLGCGTHRVEIFRRGGKVRVGEITGVSSVEWNRVRDDISTAKVVVSGWGLDCGNLLAKLQTWAYEVVIFRDNGYSVDRVWEGPITLLTYESDTVTIHAKDVMAYAYRRIIKQAMSDTGDAPTAGSSVTDRAARVLLNVFAPDDPNVLAYLQVLEQPDDAKQYRSTPAYSRTGFEEVDDMAANAGLDYTAIGRAILLWGTKHRIGTLPEFRDKDLGASPIVSEYGMSMANVYAISDGNGTYGQADRLNTDDQDPTYGLVEVLSSTWASDSTEETGTYTEAGLTTVRQSFADAAERSIADKYPPPVVVRVPDNTRLNPDTVLSIQRLVPGVVVPLRSTSTLRTVVASQKLDAVKVIETGGEETITVTLSPFSRDDTAVEEGEG